MGGPKTGVKRVKSGCVTCRIRKVKCDEEKPACRRCLSTHLKCDGYSTLAFSRRDLQAASRSASRQQSPFSASEGQDGLLSRLVTDPAFSDLLEKRYFQFFRQRTVASTNSIIDSRFWDRVVLQACHTEPAIRHAVLALSSLHQLNGLPKDSDNANQHRNYAEKQHLLAVAEARILVASATPQDVDRILIACIIFIIFEGVRGDYRAAAMHMDSGRAIVAQNSQRLKQTSRRKDLVEIEHALARLDLPAICFTDRSSPYRYNLMDFYQTDPILTPDRFHDVHEAQASLIDLTRWLLVVCNHIDHEHRNGDLPSLARYQAEKARCAAAFDKWDKCFQDMLARTPEEASTPTILNLKIWRACTTVNVAVDHYGTQTRYDACMPSFEQGIEHAETLARSLAEPDRSRSFSFDLGYSIPLYYTATRCRDPQLRRRAIALLQTYPRQEGVWESVAAGAVSARWMEVEERGLEPVRCAADIPEHRRIRYIDTKVDVDRGCASVKLTASAAERPIEVIADWKGGGGSDAGGSGGGPDDHAEAYALASDHYLHTLKKNDSLPTFDVRLSPPTLLRQHSPSDTMPGVMEDVSMSPGSQNSSPKRQASSG